MTEVKLRGFRALAPLAAMMLVSFGCARTGGQGRAVAPPATAVEVETAERRDVPVMAELVARTQSTAEVILRANVEGRLTETSFEEWRMVKEGQTLFRIDPRRYDAEVRLAESAVQKAQADLEMAREQQRLVNAQSAVRSAEANLLRADTDLARLKPLAARRAVPQRDLDLATAAQASAAAAVEDARATLKTTTVGDRLGIEQAAAGLTAARASLDRAKLDQDETVIRAPISGLIGKAEVSTGNYVGRGDPRPLATISQIDPIEVVFDIPEALYLGIRAKVERSALDRIELILSDNSTYPFKGRFINIGHFVEAKTGTLQLVAEFPNPKAVLLPGMFGRVRLAVETKQGAVLVPERALFDVQGSKAVYIVTGGNKVALRSVESDGSYEGQSIIDKGLQGGETVIVEGIMKVRPGQTVTESRRAARVVR